MGKGKKAGSALSSGVQAFSFGIFAGLLWFPCTSMLNRLLSRDGGSLAVEVLFGIRITVPALYEFLLGSGFLSYMVMVEGRDVL